MSNKAKPKTHWAADIFPLNEDDVAAIAEDIKANGQKLPILTTEDGRIIDGRNRWLACQKLGIEPKTEVAQLNGGGDEEILALSEIGRAHV